MYAKCGFNSFMIQLGYDADDDECKFGDGMYKWVDHLFGDIFANKIRAQTSIHGVCAVIKHYIKVLPTFLFFDHSVDLICEYFEWPGDGYEADCLYRLVNQ